MKRCIICKKNYRIWRKTFTGFQSIFPEEFDKCLSSGDGADGRITICTRSETGSFRHLRIERD